MIAECAAGMRTVDTYFGGHYGESVGSREIGMVECLVWGQGEARRWVW